MAALITALDNHTPKQLGENGHVELGWSNNIEEKIVQFSFQVTRTDIKGIKNLQVILKNLLENLQLKIKFSSLPEKTIAKLYLSILYRLIGQTRDILEGKGECILTYMMIYTWYEYFPELSKFALKCLVDLNKSDIHPYGSWKDIKYFCKYCKENEKCDIQHPLLQYSIFLLNEQLHIDNEKFLFKKKDLTLVAKWIPREKSSFGWLYQELATRYFESYMHTAKNEKQIKKAILKCKTEYRILVSTLNKFLETLQIKQCDKRWQEINFDRVTSISISKQKKAFLNIKKNGEIRFPLDEDRIKCADNFKARIKKSLNKDDEENKEEIKGKRVCMSDFTNQALDLLSNHYSSQDEIDLLNSQWRDNSKQNLQLGNMIAMVDVSGSMKGDPLNVAIALGIRIAEKSLLGKRVMTFSQSPSWVNLDNYEEFVEQVDIISKANWAMNTNFYAALDLILDAIIQSKMTPEEAKNMVLVILSDMQMDSGDSTRDKNSLYLEINKKYSDVGIRHFGIPLEPPHILFWNLRSTSGFPTLSSQPNCSMMSGFSPTLLNQFCEQGMNALLKSCSPWSLLVNSLDNERFKILLDKLEEEILI